MWPYILVLVVTCGWIFLQSKAYPKSSPLFIPLCILVIFASMRHYTVGSDAPSYTLWFRIPFSVDSFTLNENVELGYQFLLKMMLGIFDNYAEYFFIVSCIIILPIFILLRRYSVNYLFSVYVYITFGFYTALFNPVRQMIAVSLCFYACRFILDKRFFQYCILVVIASSFHISALLMLPMYLVCNNNCRVELKCAFAFLISGLGASVVINYMATDNIRYSNYTEAMSGNGNGLYTVTLYTFIAVFIYFFGGELRAKNKIYNLSEQMYLIGVSILIPLVALKTDPSGPQRIISYFSIFLVLIFPFIFRSINNKFLTLVFLIFCFAYYILTTTYFGDIYPYKVNEIFDIL